MSSAIEFIPKETKYHYGCFYNEKKTGYYISDKTINDVITKIKWELTSLEKCYIEYWKKFEAMHRDFCLNKINENQYENDVKELYLKYSSETEYDFGENCDELTNHIIRCLE